MNKDNFIILPEQTRINAFTETATRKALPAVAVEKDWWVTTVLRALFALPYAENLSFKGGTSLSKCYNLIERFSEDIDIAVNRDFLVPYHLTWCYFWHKKSNCLSTISKLKYCIFAYGKYRTVP